MKSPSGSYQPREDLHGLIEIPPQSDESREAIEYAVKGVDNTYHCGGGMLYHLGDA